MGLPSMGLVPATRVSGLVVTPACDLANCKTETVTYVPIVPINIFLQMPEFLVEVSRFGGESMEKLGMKKPRSANDLLDPALLIQLTELAPAKGKEELQTRCLMALKYLQKEDQRVPAGKRPTEIIREILGSGWIKVKERLVRNSYRSDIYYLPPDYQHADWSAVPLHSIALLRYLITVPTYFLDEAHAADVRDWEHRRSRLLERQLHWCHGCHETTPPLRALRLKDAFLSDLLTKLVSIYVRLGAPDLDHTSLARIEGEL